MLQNLFLEEIKLKEEYDAMVANLQYLHIEIKVNDLDSEYLMEQKEALAEGLKEAMGKNE